jgi:hypothetical protein
LWLAFFVLVVVARIVGGGSLASIVDEYAAILSFLLAVFLSVSLLVLYFEPKNYLGLLDKVRLPRWVSYVLLATGTIHTFVRRTGTRELQFLELKQLGTRTPMNRLRAYYRLVAPTFGVTLSRQMIHARSLSFRGFFTRHTQSAVALRIVSLHEFLLVLAFFVNAIVWRVIQQCVS